MIDLDPKNMASFIKLVSGEWIVACLVGMNEMGITVAFPTTKDAWSMWLEETDVQVFQFTHSDYVIIKAANERVSNRWGDFVKRKYPDHYQALAEQIVEMARITKIPLNTTIH